MLIDCEDFTVFTNAMELHYIDMKAFAKAVNEANSINIDVACKDEEEIFMAISTLAMQGEDKYTRQAYARRQDEIYFHNLAIAKAERRAEVAEAEIEKLRKEIETLRANQDA